MNMKVSTIIAVQGTNVADLGDLLMVADAVASIEGKDLYKHTAKMNVAAGDLAACLTEAKDGFPAREDVFDEVASLVIRATIFGVAHGMNAAQLAAAIERESVRMVGGAVSERVSAEIKKSGFKGIVEVPLH